MPRLVLVLIGALSLASLASTAQAQTERPSCAKVISAVNHYTTSTGGKRANPRAVARTLNTETGWVRTCMKAYGRVPPWRGEGDDQQREALEHASEEGRDVEITAETNDQIWDKKRELQIEQREALQRKKEMQKAREFFQGSDPFYKMQEY